MAEQKSEQDGAGTGESWAMWFALAAVILGVVGLWVALGASVKPDATVVIAARELPAYSRLTTSDVSTATLAIDDTSKTLTDTAVVVGQIVVGALANGEALSASMLLNAPQVEADWWILALPMTTTVAPAPGETILLIGVDETGATLSVSDQAVALGLQGTEVVVALPPEDGLIAAAYRADGRDLLVVRTVER